MLHWCQAKWQQILRSPCRTYLDRSSRFDPRTSPYQQLENFLHHRNICWSCTRSMRQVEDPRGQPEVQSGASFLPKVWLFTYISICRFAWSAEIKLWTSTLKFYHNSILQRNSLKKMSIFWTLTNIIVFNFRIPILPILRFNVRKRL